MKNKGFSLLELLIVVSIIGILSVIGLIVFFNLMQNSRVQASKATLLAIYKQVEEQRALRQQTLIQVTGNACTSCGPCRATETPVTYTTESVNSAGCIAALKNTYINRLGMQNIPQDGWGDPIMLDENEYEYPSDLCRKDWIWSIHSFSGASFTIPFYTSCDGI
jgi:prepilin-type N-terminal cleavage/methylation domain-containing protein